VKKVEQLQTENSAAGGLSDLTDVLAGEPKQLNRCVVRLRTTMWADKSGLHTKKSLTFLRRKSEGFNVLEDDTSAVGAEGVLPRILNMDECPDGVYEVVTCNERHDYETGCIDDYDYRLVAANAGVTGLPRKDD
jgi:hypothetical protein